MDGFAFLGIFDRSYLHNHGTYRHEHFCAELSLFRSFQRARIHLGTLRRCCSAPRSSSPWSWHSPPNLPPPYLPHFPSVQHVLGICRTPLIPSYYTSNTRVVKTTSLLSIFPSLVAASFRICHHCLHHISESARWISAKVLSSSSP